MSEQCQQTLTCRPDDLHSAISIHTRKITDSCRDKDCIEDLRVFLTKDSQTILDSAPGAKVRCAELLYTAIDVSPVAFSRNHYCIDLTFYYRIVADAGVNACRPTSIYGLATFSKRAVLCGAQAGAHIFSSDECCSGCRTGLPTAVAEVLDPMVLSSKVVDALSSEPCSLQIPEQVQCHFDDELVLGGEKRRLLVTLGQFSIIRLERDAQIVVPVLDYSIPTKECCDNPGCAEDPCQVFSRIPFPAAQFTPTDCECESCPAAEPYQTT